ncbi:ribulose-phosphate 3 epimerase family protein [Toxoplasma gondii ME49]|uniref:ribulose-phosphate 3-epimerase n=4 Tax=Toxoplasma gondii TaxID=5811 RepID=A0A125YRL8_TOXGV|nr:ribulose-phosphate 3 epimerase family protein [Toxoplasma gondii ME49]EPT24955.1 ribulose-phosphate 3 epimerase family protein [Toxoplasma gondii ME49]ESS34338.1 ribulose-phosphate 3 epimerase family protein [Toxoplasma gondii VEG]KFG46739.1 ribulose-phosphate 3 epimerase family protein [Toxoplasma gondii GAB2-2007-GAL-DOM2]|eukprot:XP_018634973.1 ribulose-phosphate 3 epimerase family protein [Toxoplasma gondii ME49]
MRLASPGHHGRVCAEKFCEFSVFGFPRVRGFSRRRQIFHCGPSISSFFSLSKVGFQLGLLELHFEFFHVSRCLRWLSLGASFLQESLLFRLTRLSVSNLDTTLHPASVLSSAGHFLAFSLSVSLKEPLRFLLPSSASLSRCIWESKPSCSTLFLALLFLLCFSCSVEHRTVCLSLSVPVFASALSVSHLPLSLSPFAFCSLVRTRAPCLLELASRLCRCVFRHFVPNISFGPGVVKALRGHLKSAFFDVHLMVSEPEKWIQPFADAGANSITFHWESVGGDLQRAAELAKRIQARGIKAGLAIKPATKFEDLGEALAGDNFDMLLVMTVEPGFGGQKFMADMLQKVRTARSLFPKLNIQVDGGLDGETVKPAASAGANVIVAGTSMFKAENPAALMTFMRDVIAASDTL